MEPNKNHNLEDKVMESIKGGSVKLRSRYLFLAEKLGLGSALVLSILLAVLFFSMVLFYLQATDNLWYLSFGSRGVYAFLESFPYFLVVALIILILLSGWILKKSGVFYQRPFTYSAIGLLCLIFFVGTCLAFTNLSEKIENDTFNNQRPAGFFHMFLSRGLSQRDRGAAGKIVEVGDGFIDIQTPDCRKRIDLTKLVRPLNVDLEPGMFVIAVGGHTGEVFVALDMRVLGERDLPMIRRGIHREFGPSNERRPLLPCGSEPKEFRILVK